MAEITMGPGSTLITAPDWSLMGGFDLIPFYDSNYGLMYNQRQWDGTTNEKPPSLAYLYRIDIDTTRPTGYKFTLLASGLLTNFAKFAGVGAGTWATNSLQYGAFAINATQIVVPERLQYPTGPSTVGIITRAPNNTLTYQGGQASNVFNISANNPNYVRTGPDTFARGYYDGSYAFVDGIQVAANGTCTILSTSAAGSFPGHPLNYALMAYNGYDGCLMGWPGDGAFGTSIVFARPWTPAGGFSGAGVSSVLTLDPNVGPRDGFLGSGIETREMTWGQQFHNMGFSSSNGATWTNGTESDTEFPFASVGSPPYPLFNQHQHYEKWLTLGHVNPNSTSWRLDYALTSQSNAVPTLASRASTGITYANFGYRGFGSTSPSANKVARHSATLVVVFADPYTTSFQANAAYAEPIAFATP